MSCFLFSKRKSQSWRLIFDCLRSSLYSTSCFWLNNPFTERGSFGCFDKTALETELYWVFAITLPPSEWKFLQRQISHSPFDEVPSSPQKKYLNLIQSTGSTMMQSEVSQIVIQVHCSRRYLLILPQLGHTTFWHILILQSSIGKGTFCDLLVILISHLISPWRSWWVCPRSRCQ